MTKLRVNSAFECVHQSSDCKPRDKFSQFINERLVDNDAERLLRKQLAVPHENAALSHQPNGPAHGGLFLCVWRQKSTYDIDRSRKIRDRIRRHEFAKDLGGMCALPGEHTDVAAHFVAEQQRPQLLVHEASQSLLAGERLELLRIKSRIFRQLREGGFEDLEVQTVLAFEMIIDGSLIDARFGDDVSHARTLEAFLRKQSDGGLDDRLAGVFSWTGHWLPIQTTV